MRLPVSLIAAAPLALLAACGSNEEADELVVAPTEEPAPMGAATTATAADDGPIEAVRLADADLAGTYALTDPQGQTTRVRLDPAGTTYSYTAPDGTERRGTYRLYDDYRLEIEDWDGGPAYFTFDNSRLYRISSATADPTDRIEVTAAYDRDNTSAAQTGGPSATTNSVADKRQ